MARPVLAAAGIHPKAAGFLEMGGTYGGAYLLRRGLFMPWELSSVMDVGLAREGLERLAPIDLVNAELNPRPSGSMARLSTLEASLYMKNQLLRDTDWASMAHNIEVRVPLVDPVLLSRLAPLEINQRNGSPKRDLAVAPSRPLPSAFRSRPKTGFTTPIAQWQQRSPTGLNSAAAAEKLSKNIPWARSWACRVIAA